MKLYEILSKYRDIRSEIYEGLPHGGIIVVAILTHAWVMVQCTQMLVEFAKGDSDKPY